MRRRRKPAERRTIASVRIPGIRDRRSESPASAGSFADQKLAQRKAQAIHPGDAEFAARIGVGYGQTLGL